MKTTKKIILLVLALMVVFSSIGAVQGARYFSARYFIRQGQTVTLSMGRVGVTYTKAWLAGTAVLTKTDRAPSDASLVFRQDYLDFRFYDANNVRQRRVTGPVYVWYELRKGEVSAWDAGQIKIYYFDTWLNRWRVCPTFEVGGGYEDQVRIACRIWAYGLYGIAVRR